MSISTLIDMNLSPTVVTMFANAIAPTAYFWPGILPLSIDMAAIASVLAAFLERPFFTAAGVQESALRYSLRANCVSLIIGYLTLPLAIPALYTIGPLWSVVAIAVSISAEIWYLRPHSSGPLRWSPIILGNIISSVILLLIPYGTLWLKQSVPSSEALVAPFHTTLYWSTLIGTAVIFVASFMSPRRQAAVGEAWLASGVQPLTPHASAQTEPMRTK